MTTQTAVVAQPSQAHGPEDGAKRRQIMDGASAVFLAQGFDAASMGEIARAAGVSKGTLYVYFENKEQLFEATVHQRYPNHPAPAATIASTTAMIASLRRRAGGV